jgi:hypothetical protein
VYCLFETSVVLSFLVESVVLSFLVESVGLLFLVESVGCLMLTGFWLAEAECLFSGLENLRGCAV